MVVFKTLSIITAVLCFGCCTGMLGWAAKRVLKLVANLRAVFKEALKDADDQ